MSNSPSPLDPFALWRDLLTQWERGTNALVNRATGSDAFSEGMHKSLGASLAAKKLSTDAANKYLAALNVPSRDDVAALGERLHSIEERLFALTELVERIAGSDAGVASSTAGPRRTRKPPVLADPPAEPAPGPSAPATSRRKATKKGARP